MPNTPIKTNYIEVFCATAGYGHTLIDVGDFVMRGSDNNFYPYKKFDFERNFEFL